MNTILVQGNSVKVNVSVYVFLDTDYPKPNMWIAYCPSLNIIGYGYGEDAAKKDFEFMLDEYFTEQLKNKTLEQDLKNFGWKKYNKAFDEPKATDLAAHDEMFSEVLNAPMYSKINIGNTYPAYA